jgi:hypothetical protein
MLLSRETWFRVAVVWKIDFHKNEFVCTAAVRSAHGHSTRGDILSSERTYSTTGVACVHGCIAWMCRIWRRRVWRTCRFVDSRGWCTGRWRVCDTCWSWFLCGIWGKKGNTGRTKWRLWNLCVCRRPGRCATMPLSPRPLSVPRPWWSRFRACVLCAIYSL